jgi:hypothetical protein
MLVTLIYSSYAQALTILIIHIILVRLIILIILVTQNNPKNLNNLINRKSPITLETLVLLITLKRVGVGQQEYRVFPHDCHLINFFNFDL